MQRYVFNPMTLMYEPHEEPRYKRVLRIIGFIVGACALCYLYFWLYTSVFGWDLPKTTLLKRQNAEWKAKISLLDRQLNICESVLDGIEERDDNVYRSIFGLNEVPEVQPAADERYAQLDNSGADPKLKQTVKRIDNLSKRTYIQSTALDEVYTVSKTAGDMVSHIPAVPPLLPDKSMVHLASPFGYRTDPVYGGSRFHAGQDLAVAQGYPVYATGDGVVITTDFKFTGYGNEIVIDHGFGYKTRYAHLSRISVGEGMHVKRGDLIGAVGSTGKSTGPHLHYEVLYKDNAINPNTFMDMDMPLDEYRAMINQRKEEAEPQQKSTMELIKGRKK